MYAHPGSLLAPFLEPMRFEMLTETYVLPDFWLSGLINGDYTGYSEEENAQLEAFTKDMVGRHGRCWALSTGEAKGFMRYHDAECYGVLACNAVEVIFDVAPDGPYCPVPREEGEDGPIVDLN